MADRDQVSDTLTEPQLSSNTTGVRRLGFTFDTPKKATLWFFDPDAFFAVKMQKAVEGLFMESYFDSPSLERLATTQMVAQLQQKPIRYGIQFVSREQIMQAILIDGAGFSCLDFK